MSACSRCGSRWPNSACFVCAEPDSPERDWFEAHDEYEAMQEQREREEQLEPERMTP